ncbi:MAG: OsmC family protein [Candidatus Omnitrophica bacterium]|nr:OsmC family protein [Candidatus Omnitrophota bacterium]MCM8790322.1 OsmC family protein [Candidatus Omnitrophota bacterium]
MYRADVTYIGNRSFSVKTKNATFIIDADGKDGATPPDAFLASLGSCIGVYIRKYAEGARLALSRFDITVEGDLGKEPPFYFRQIKVDVNFQEPSGLDERRKNAMLEFVKNCPLHNTLKHATEIDISI